LDGRQEQLVLEDIALEMFREGLRRSRPGVLPVNGMFGDADDAPLSPVDDGIVSRIVSIAIKGAALGTVGGSDHYGFVAQQIGLLSVGGTAYPLKPGAGNDLAGLAVGATGDVRVREVAV
jgi:hypothetical protein